MEYSGINAKIKAMKGKLLRYNDFESLSNLATVEEIGAKLKENPSYKRALDTLDGNEMRRGSIEHRLFISLMDDFSRIYNFLNGFGYKKYTEAYTLRYEINILQLLLSIVFDERDITYSFPEMSKITGHQLKIDISKLAESKNVSEFLERLQGTQYYHVLDGENMSRTSLFEMETKLDIYYYIHLWRLQNKYLDKNNVKVLSVVNGAEIDLRNLMWLYRLKKYYSISEPAIYGYLIPVQFNITKEQIFAIARTKTESELISEIMRTKYGEALFANGDIEKNFSFLMSKLYKSSALKNPNSLAGLVAYLHSKAQEIGNLTILLEGVRYELKPEEIMSRLYVSGNVDFHGQRSTKR